MKMLKLEIKGFRSLKDVKWEPGDLNVVIGPNGSGKSNLLYMLDVIRAANQGDLSKWIDSMGGFIPNLWDQSASEISFQISFDDRYNQDNVAKSNLIYELNLKSPNLMFGSYVIANEKLASYFISEKDKENKPYIYLQRSELNGTIYDEKKNQWLKADENIHSNETLLSSIANIPGANYYPKITLFRANTILWGIYQDIQVHRASAIRYPQISKYEQYLSSDISNIVTVLHTLYTNDREFRMNIDSAMNAVFDDYEALVFPPAYEQRIFLGMRWKSLNKVQSSNVLSDGTLRFLILLTILADSTPSTMIAIDEPELGLHPKMLPIIAEFAVEASKKSQVIFTTHSPQFLNAFRDTTPTITVCEWENGETKLKFLDKEKLEYWLKDYSMGTLFESGELEDM